MEMNEAVFAEQHREEIKLLQDKIADLTKANLHLMGEIRSHIPPRAIRLDEQGRIILFCPECRKQWATTIEGLITTLRGLQRDAETVSMSEWARSNQED